MEKLNGYTIGDKQIYVGRFQKKAERNAEMKRKKDQQRLERMNKYQGVNLYIKNLDDTIDDEHLRTEFSKFGTITSAKVSVVDGLFRCVLKICVALDHDGKWSFTRLWFRLFQCT